MERLAILDHVTNVLYIEDVSGSDLENYGGSEEAYIKDNYKLDGDFSWDYITDTQYFPEGESVPMDVEFTELY